MISLLAIAVVFFFGGVLFELPRAAWQVVDAVTAVYSTDSASAGGLE